MSIFSIIKEARKNREEKENAIQNERIMLLTKVNDYEECIDQQQLTLGLNNIEIKKIQKYSIFQSSFHDLLKQKENYDQAIWQYHFVIHILKQVNNLCEDLPFYIHEYKAAKNEATELKIDKYTDITKRHRRFYHLQYETIDADNKIYRTKNKVTEVNDCMFCLYDYYKVQLIILSELCKKCEKEQTFDNYLIQNKKLLRDIHEDLYLSLDDLPVLINQYLTCIVNLLEDLLSYYKEVNSICELIIEKGKQDLDSYILQDIMLDEFTIDSLNQISYLSSKEQIEDLFKAIQYQRDTLVISNKKISTLDLSSQSELVKQKEKNCKVIEQYYTLYHFLDQVDITFDPLVSRFEELSKKEATALKDEMIHLYSYYQDQISLLNELFIDYEIDQTGDLYLIQDSKLLRNIDNSLFLSINELPVLSDLFKECKIKLLYDLLGYYKKQNEICDKILNQKDV